MDPTQPIPQNGFDPNSIAAKNALMLQAIKGQQQQSMAAHQAEAAATGAPPMSGAPGGGMPAPTAPTDPNGQAGGLGAQMQQQMTGMGQVPVSQMGMLSQQPGMQGMPGMQQPNPVAAALMSQIPGGQ